MTVPVKTVASEAFDKHVHFLCDLYGRWYDEGFYEDINDYKDAIQAQIPELEVIQAHKRPWGFTAKAEGKTYRFKITARTASYQRIA